MNTTYIFRMDDISPTMDWNRFDALLRLFIANEVKPLLGIIPDNQDPRLAIDTPRSSFWETMRKLSGKNLVDIAQHGYQHILEPRYTAQLPSYLCPRRPYSEFAGDPLEIQVEKILRGKRILLDEGLDTTYWMAPNHSLDATTLEALRLTGFEAATDGIALYPFTDNTITFVPQQTWRPRWTPGGIQTICLHSDNITIEDIRRIRHFLRGPHHITRFSSVTSALPRNARTAIRNKAFQFSYRLARDVRGSISGK